MRRSHADKRRLDAMNQAAGLVLGIVLSSLLTNEVTCYIPKSGQPFVAGHCQPHPRKLSAL